MKTIHVLPQEQIKYVKTISFNIEYFGKYYSGKIVYKRNLSETYKMDETKRTDIDRCLCFYPEECYPCDIIDIIILKGVREKYPMAQVNTKLMLCDVELQDITKELSNYVGKNGHGYTHDPFSHNHSGCTGYDSSIVEQVSITFDNQTHTADAWKKDTGLRSDCSGGVSAMLFFMGVTGSGNKIDNNPSTTYKGIGTAVTGTKFADLQPGDIIAKSGHVAMVVYKDTDKTLLRIHTLS